MRNSFIVPLLTAAILACVAPTTMAEQPKDQSCRSFNIDYSKVKLPDRFGATEAVERTVFKEQGAGMLVRYSRPADGTSWIDVFVYPICLPKSCSLAQMNELEMAKVLKEIEMTHPGAQVQGIESFTGEHDGKKYEALRTKVGTTKDRRWLSFVYLALVGDVYVKIRSTQPEGKDYESQLDALAASFLTELRFEGPRAHMHETVPTLFINSTETESGKRHVLSALLSYGAFLSIEVEKGRYLDTLDRSLKCWELTLKILEGIKSEQCLDAIDASFAGIIAARNAGYFKEYLWTYFRRPYWIQPQGFRYEDFEVWASHNLKGHVPCNTNRILVQWK
jgi:hypothetical protein